MEGFLAKNVLCTRAARARARALAEKASFLGPFRRARARGACGENIYARTAFMLRTPLKGLVVGCTLRY